MSNRLRNKLKKLYPSIVTATLLLSPAISQAAAIEIPFLNDLWDTMKQNVLPVVMGLGLLGAFIADRHDNETAKRILLGVAGTAIAFKVVLAFIVWIKATSAGI